MTPDQFEAFLLLLAEVIAEVECEFAEWLDTALLEDQERLEHDH